MKSLTELLKIMAALRDPVSGCPWDIKQTIASIAPFTQEEVYELIEAIELNDMDSVCDELGDLLFHIVFYAQMAKESGAFSFEDIASNVGEKLKRRHPHVFTEQRGELLKEAGVDWESIKYEERADKNKEQGIEGHYLDGISQAQPSLSRAYKLQKRAAAVGFDWSEVKEVLAKIEEELAELGQEIEHGTSRDRLNDEIGDLLFAVINCARHLDIDPEQALRSTNRKFEQRFNYIEDQLRSQQQDLPEATLVQMESLWQEAKSKED